MTTRDRRATAAKFSASAANDEPAPAVRSTARTKRVRRTVDLAPARHHALTRWCEDVAMELGVARVSGQDVISALVGRLLTDELLARKIRGDLERDLEP
jgi:hypothetical protein